ncbi:MAG TPA: hypothetical protein VIV20_06205 [Gammaproteobacteria bacterium]
MTDKNLRTLAREYSEGKLKKADYRRERDMLIEGILSGNITVEENNFRPLLDLSMPQHTIEKDPPEIILEEDLEEQPEDHQLPGQNFYLLSTITFIIFISICIVIYMLTQKELSKPESKTSDTELQMDLQALSHLIPETFIIEDFIQRFIRKNDWSDTSRQAFLENWLSLSPEERQTVLELPISNQLANKIYEQLIEQRALYQVGDKEDSIRKQRELVEFAEIIGIDDSRIRVQRMEDSGKDNPLPDEAGQASPEGNQMPAQKDAGKAIHHINKPTI